MEFKSPALAKSKLTRLQFYNSPPSETIELNELEDYAVQRIRVLKCIEAVGQDCVRGTKEYDDKVVTELTKLGGFGKIFTACSSSSKNAKEDIRKDIISHFILQVRYSSLTCNFLHWSSHYVFFSFLSAIFLMLIQLTPSF
ncbi:unnamed protein product [Trichobilharzia regenti]|nr:unnamed protein product [Trichobilharzia regenti]